MPLLCELDPLPTSAGAATIQWADPPPDDKFPLPTITTGGVITLPRLDGAAIIPLPGTEEFLFVAGTDPESVEDFTHHWLLGTHRFGEVAQPFCVRFLHWH